MMFKAKASLIVPLALLIFAILIGTAAFAIIDTMRGEHGTGASNDNAPGYDISIGYQENMEDGLLTNAGTKFGEKAGLIALVRFPEAAPVDASAALTVTVKKSNQVVMEEQLHLTSGMSSHSFQLHAEQWEMGEYQCTFAMNGSVVASQSFYFQ